MTDVIVTKVSDVEGAGDEKFLRLGYRCIAKEVRSLGITQTTNGEIVYSITLRQEEDYIQGIGEIRVSSTSELAASIFVPGKLYYIEIHRDNTEP